MKKVIMILAMLGTLTACSGTEDGVNGAPGIPGESCTIADLEPSEQYPTGGVRITCGETSEVVLNPETPQDDPDEVVVLPCEEEHKIKSRDRKCRFNVERDEHGHRHVTREED